MSQGVTYQWRNADVEIVACEKHAREIVAALNLMQRLMAHEAPVRAETGGRG